MLLVGTGLAAAVPTALSGTGDWAGIWRSTAERPAAAKAVRTGPAHPRGSAVDVSQMLVVVAGALHANPLRERIEVCDLVR
jgi:hypothetical protein